MSSPEFVLAVYRPKPGSEKQLQALVRKHVPRLRELGLATAKEAFYGSDEKGAIVEAFEWTSADAVRIAHDHPAVAEIWEAMGEVSDFGTLSQLAGAEKPFPHFRPF